MPEETKVESDAPHSPAKQKRPSGGRTVLAKVDLLDGSVLDLHIDVCYFNVNLSLFAFEDVFLINGHKTSNVDETSLIPYSDFVIY